MEWFQQDFIEEVPVYGIILREKEFRSFRHQCEVPLESSRTVIVVITSVKEVERQDQGHASVSLLLQSAT
jgi:hypothetical protein